MERSFAEVGEAVLYYRGVQGLTQEQLARKAGLSPSTIVRIENGEFKRLRISTVLDLEEALGVGGKLLPLIAGPPTMPDGPSLNLALTAVFERGEQGWWVASCLEVPEAITQGRDLQEARENLLDAVRLELEARREDAEKEFEGRSDVIREPLAAL